MQTALQAIGANVTVTAVDSADFGLQFVGAPGSKFQTPISINVSSITGGTSANPATATVGVRLTRTGEFLVNDTTANNQMFPSIAMNATGAFVISWTGYGQNGDGANNSNVYSKQFVGNSVLEATGAASSLGTTAPTSASTKTPTSIPGATVKPLVTTTDNPTNHVVAADGAWTASWNSM